MAVHLKELFGTVVGVEQRCQQVCLAGMAEEVLENVQRLRRISLDELLREKRREGLMEEGR